MKPFGHKEDLQCLHCEFFRAARKKWPKMGYENSDEIFIDVVKSAIAIAANVMMCMNDSDRVGFLRESLQLSRDMETHMADQTKH